MKQIVYLGDEDVAITLGKAGKTVMVINGEVYTVNTSDYRNQLETFSTTDAEVVKEKEEGN